MESDPKMCTRDLGSTPRRGEYWVLLASFLFSSLVCPFVSPGFSISPEFKAIEKQMDYLQIVLPYNPYRTLVVAFLVSTGVYYTHLSRPKVKWLCGIWVRLPDRDIGPVRNIFLLSIFEFLDDESFFSNTVQVWPQPSTSVGKPVDAGEGAIFHKLTSSQS